MVEVIEAKHVEGYIIWLKFNNGVCGNVDLENELWGTVFEPLKNLDIFKKFSVSKEFGTIVWENEADFAPEFLLNKVMMSHEISRGTPGDVTERVSIK